MSKLMPHIRRCGTFASRGTTRAPPSARVHSTWALGGGEEESSARACGKILLKYGSVSAFAAGIFKWIGYDAYGKSGAECEKLKAEINRERAAIKELEKQLDED